MARFADRYYVSSGALMHLPDCNCLMCRYPKRCLVPRDERIVGLVACSSTKLDRSAPARELYSSPLFKLARGFVEQTCETWAILSARHGLVLPDTVLEPYEDRLAARSVAERRAWADRVTLDLTRRWPWARFVVLAGVDYRQALRGLHYEAPLEGLGIGEQLHWLKENAP